MKNQIKSEIGTERTRLENLVNTVEDILDNVIKWRDNIHGLGKPNLKSEESAAQRKELKVKGLKILTPIKCLIDYQFL